MEPGRLRRRTLHAWFYPALLSGRIATVVSDYAAIGAILQRLIAWPTAQLAVALVMVIWGVASDALRNLITGFLSNISFGG